MQRVKGEYARMLYAFLIIIALPILQWLKTHKLSEEEWLNEIGDTMQHVWGWNGPIGPHDYEPTWMINHTPLSLWGRLKNRTTKRRF